jgi:hypothetical protein
MCAGVLYGERERNREGERETGRERGRKSERERCRICPELFIFERNDRYLGTIDI